MSEVYWGRFSRQEDGTWMATDAECVIPPAVLAENSQSDEQRWLTAGTGWEAYQEALAELKFEVAAGEVLFPDAEDIVALAKFELSRATP